jgi:hypothetical protein
MNSRLSSVIRLGLLATATALCLGGAALAQQPFIINVPAPELVSGAWLNTAGGKPITLASRRGKVTVVEFWTFG